MINYIDKKIDGRFNCIKENIESIRQSLDNLAGDIEVIGYLSFLKEHIKEKCGDTITKIKEDN
jgi:hypothetical protein